MTSIPNRLTSAAAAIAAGFALCTGAAGNAEHVQTPAELSQPKSSLIAEGDAQFKAKEYASAEAAYTQALRLAEQQGGPDGERVLAPLLGLGNTLAASGHHVEALPYLQRALAIERAKYGLFDLRQQDTLRTLADTLTALNRVSDAQEMMLYRVRAAEKTYGERNPKMMPVLCELGDWFAENLKSAEARMTFQMALNIVGTTPSLMDPIIVEPLRGIARTRMRAQSYPPSPLRPHESTEVRYNSMGVPLPGPREFNKEGEEALKRALQIIEADPSATSPTTHIETLLQMGDWYQIKKSPREALLYYQGAWQLIRTTPNLPDTTSNALDVPVRVYYPTPPIVTHVPAVSPADTRFHHVQMEFTVAADGSVQNARIVNHDTRDRYAREILDAVRDSRFRPKFVDGQPVAAPGVTYREVMWTGKPRE